MAQAIRGDGTLDRAMAAVRREFAELPGLSLTLEQAERLWGLDPSTCRAVLGRLVDRGELRESDGHFLRPGAH
jgi:Fic family protein